MKKLIIGFIISVVVIISGFNFAINYTYNDIIKDPRLHKSWKGVRIEDLNRWQHFVVDIKMILNSN